jgi:hypothetical protein
MRKYAMSRSKQLRILPMSSGHSIEQLVGGKQEISYAAHNHHGRQAHEAMDLLMKEIRNPN